LKTYASYQDIDLFAEGAQEHWYEAYPLLHEQAPVLRIPGEGLVPGTDGFVLSKYDDIERVVKDPERYTPTMSLGMEALVAQGSDNTDGFNLALQSLVTLRPDMELWRSHRQELTDPWVGPGARRHQQMITEIVDELIDNWIEQPQIDFVAQFARPLPQRVTARVLGFPDADVEQLARWGTAQVMSFVYGKGHRNELSAEQLQQQTAELRGFEDYVREQIQRKRDHPADDMISFLTEVVYTPLQRRLTDAEIQGVVYFMVLGGLETTQYALAEQAQLLCETAGMFDALKADPDKVRAFTEESMRLRAPTQGLSTRITTRDEVFQGMEVPAGSLLHLRWAAGNVDPERYECPYQLDLERKALGNHLTFSQGPRTCPGAGISRLEQQIAWQRLLQRLAAIAYAPDNSMSHQPGIMLGTDAVHLRITPQR
jgi:cytochrome P450